MAISIIHTPCKGCCFAEYEDKTQTGCLLNLLDEYKNLDGVDILEAYDDTHEFYIVNGKKCAAHKDQKYFKSKGMENSTTEEKIKHINEVMKLKYLLAIDCKDKTPEDLAEILDEVKISSVHPSAMAIVILRVENQEVYEVEKYYKVLNKSGIKCRWKVKILNIAEQDHMTTVHQMINLGAEKCNFVLYVGKDHTDIKKVVDLAQKMTYTQFIPFMVIANRSREVMMFNTIVYRIGLENNLDIITNTEKHIIV